MSNTLLLTKALLFDAQEKSKLCYICQPHLSIAHGLLYYLQICGSQYCSTISYSYNIYIYPHLYIFFLIL